MSEHTNPIDTLILGAGPAGLFAALHAARGTGRVVLLERTARCGNKLLLTGGGQCNLTHGGPISAFFSHYGHNGRFLKKALYGFDNEQLVSFFGKNGLEIIYREDGKAFPASLKARDVLDTLLRACSENGVVIVYGQRATAARKTGNVIEVRTRETTYVCRTLILTTGGCSFPQTGSTGDGHEIARELGHSIVELAPALTPLKLRDFRFSDLAGLSLGNIRYSVSRKGERIHSSSGDILFTHTGLSGPGILNSSRFVKAGDVMELNLTGSSYGKLEAELLAMVSKNGARKLRNTIRELPLPGRLLIRLLELRSIDPDQRCSGLTREQRRSLVTDLTRLSLTVERPLGPGAAMVTRGGVGLDQVSPGSMGSRIVEGLFFAGEVLDIDGDTGGYNLQAAFSTGRLAGISAAGKSREMAGEH